MNENNHPHYVWAFVSLVAIGIGTWIYSSNRPDVSNYGKDSTHNEQTHHNIGLIVLQPGCQNSKAEEFMRGIKNAPVANTVKP